MILQTGLVNKVRKGGYQRDRVDCFGWTVLANSYSPTTLGRSRLSEMQLETK